MDFVHDFDEVVNRRGTDSKKYSEDVFPADVIPMWIADTDFKAPAPVVEALEERIRQGVYGYTPVSSRLRRAVQKWQAERFGWEIREEEVEFVPGVISGIISAVRAFSHPGDNLLIQTPCYPPFKDLSDHNGRNLLRNALVLRDGRYEIDFEDFEDKAKDPRTKIFILCNPQNPTGRVFTREELVRMGEICLKYHVLVLADEIHGDIVYEGRGHIPFAGISKEFEQNCVTFINPSKTFNLPGFRTAAFITRNPVLKNGVHEVVVNNKAIGENICGTVALCTAYESCGYYADQLVAYLEENRNLAEKELAHISGIRCIRAEGTYLLWLDCRGLGKNQEELEGFFVEKAKLGLNSGSSFGPEGTGFMRMNIGCPRKTLKEALKRMKDAAGRM